MSPEQQATVEAWIDTLRSGKYHQGFHNLKVGASCMCVMGVLAEIKGTPSAPFLDFVVDDGGVEHEITCWMFNFGEKYPEKTFVIPEQIFVEWTGFCRDFQEKLMRMNDTYEKPFSYLADEIEAELGDYVSR